ncbi:polysaccharide deacetylase family protein [Haloflavibacter putidus]|nr:polysaccharide deacetylase family protein [Haloflavibacter putidus]
MLLVYTKSLTPRINYTFKHVCTNILGLEVEFTSKIEAFIAHEDMKLSYGKQKMGNEFFVQQKGLLLEQGYTDTDIRVGKWDDTPCFFKVGESSDLPFDIFSASFYMLSRYEEYLPHVKDKTGRFPSNESLAVKKKFIDKPVVDIWAYKFKEHLQEKFPSFDFPEKKFRNKNILSVAQAYKYRKKGLVRSVGASLRDIFQLNLNNLVDRFKVLLFLKNDPYEIYDELVAFSKKEKIRWNFMFQLSNYSVNNKNISYNKIKYHALIKSMADYGKIGLLPGFEATKSFKTLKTEKKRWEAIVNRPLTSALVKHYDINLPQLYNNFDKLEIQEDYSMVFADVIGFRAGTCTPFLFYDINLERISPLVLQPSVINSDIFSELTYFELKTKLEKIKLAVEKVNGKLVLLFENANFEDERTKEKLLKLIYALNKTE